MRGPRNTCLRSANVELRSVDLDRERERESMKQNPRYLMISCVHFSILIFIHCVYMLSHNISIAR